jgi:hypothetical protein
VPAAILAASAIGETIGSAGRASLAQATSEITPFAALAALYAATLAGLARPSGTWRSALISRGRRPTGERDGAA